MINQKVLVQLKDNYQPGILVAKDKVQLDDGQIVLTNSIIDNTIPNTNIHQIIHQLLNNKSVNINDCLFLMVNNSAIQFQFNCNESYCFQISNSNILSFNHLIEQIDHKQSKLLQSLIILNELFKFNSNDNNLITIFNNNCFQYKYFNISNRIFAKNFKFPILNLFYNQLTNENNNYITNSNTQTQYQYPFQQIEEYNNYILQDLLKSINQISTFQLLSKLFSSILLLQMIKFDQLQQQSELINKIESNLDLGAQSLCTELTIKKRKMGNKFIEQQMNQQEMEIIKDQISTFLYYLARQITFNTNQVNNNDTQTFISLLFYSSFNTIQTNLEALIENYSIEKLNYQFYNRIKIERERDLKEVQIQFAQITLTTNLQIIELFDKKTVGLIGMIEEHTLTNTEEGKLIEKIKSLQRTYVKQMKIQPQNPQLFTINHSYGQINYSVAEFKVQNKFESLSKVAEFIQSSKDQVISSNAQTLNVQYKTNIEQYQNYMTKINEEQEKCNQIMVHQMKNQNYQDILKQLEQYNIQNYLNYYYQIYPYRYEVQDFVDTINQIYFVPPQFTLQEKLSYCQKKIYQIDHLVSANNLLFLTLEQQLKIETINDNCVTKFINFKKLLKKNYRSYILRKKLKPKIRKIKIMNAIVQLQQAITKTGAILQWNHVIQDIQFIQYSVRKYLQKQAFKKQMFARSILRSVIDSVWVKVENLMAIKLQKIFRGNKIRSQNNEIISQVKQKMIEFIKLKKTIFIQKNIRKYLCQKYYNQQLNKIISVQSQWRMLKTRKNYLKVKNQIIFIQRQFKPIILKSLVKHKEFLNFEKKETIQLNEFLKNNNKNLLDYEKLLNQQFDDQKIRIFQIILNLEFLVDLTDVCFGWLQNYSLYWSQCFHKNKPIQFLEVSETQTFAVDAVGKVYQWGLIDDVLIQSNVKYFQSGENLAIYQNDKWNCLSLDEKQAKQNMASNYSSMYIKSNHMFGYKDNSIDSFIYSTNQALRNSTLEFKKPIDQISCGHNFILYLTKGQLWSVGSNKYGQLGLGDYNDRNTPSQAQIENVIWIECGQTHAVLKTFKKCFGVGNNKYGQLGLHKKCYNSPQCLISPMNENVLSISASYRGTLFISESNKIFMTGQFYTIY
ncbi:unnamed protein product (macronuclear) [Paramecium tetraurelia]|uniref:Myosin motor domain-containing protein n=1 Tax=Paramecium tetraurelia TaxID=5888 RepID=A0BGZ1_PARTE|nr:uncharacterized protein GSPATT00028843001 [Paramecium tetraurelia]CAK57808.1 unnamed protein product [Paramecium tetraurelia]|eukprot:XP_001425206.1 hypothetical protein (macronuclear) [Paramecium tetraurelia strain d4-2]